MRCGILVLMILLVTGMAWAAKKDAIDIEAGRKHWAYQPLKAPAIPEVTDAAWPANDVDRFIFIPQRTNCRKYLAMSSRIKILCINRLCHFIPAVAIEQ